VLTAGGESELWGLVDLVQRRIDAGVVPCWRTSVRHRTTLREWSSLRSTSRCLTVRVGECPLEPGALRPLVYRREEEEVMERFI
jgi:hypothetical protein